LSSFYITLSISKGALPYAILETSNSAGFKRFSGTFLVVRNCLTLEDSTSLKESFKNESKSPPTTQPPTSLLFRTDGPAAVPFSMKFYFSSD